MSNVKLTLALTILLLLWISPNLQAQNRCPSKQGNWLTSAGEEVCRSCPSKTHFLAERALKLPRMCLALSPGVFLSTQMYSGLKAEQQFSLKLKIFQDKLQPTLEMLGQQIVSANTLVNQLRGSVLQLRDQNLDLEKHSTRMTTHRNWLIYLSSGLAVSLAAITYLNVIH